MNLSSDLAPLSTASLDDYRAARIVMEQFGEEAERRALAHANHLSEAGDHEGASRWMNVVLAIHELRRVRPGLAAIH